MSYLKELFNFFTNLLISRGTALEWIKNEKFEFSNFLTQPCPRATALIRLSIRVSE